MFDRVEFFCILGKYNSGWDSLGEKFGMLYGNHINIVRSKKNATARRVQKLISGYSPRSQVTQPAFLLIQTSGRNRDFELKNGSGFYL